MRIEVFGEELEFHEKLVREGEGEIRCQADEYLSGNREFFDLEFSVPESFTGEVMREMITIPHGERRNYGEIAEKLNSAAIAVGQACGRNPLPVVVPCHRVVGKTSLGGYCGKKSSDAKRKLLELEGADF